MKKLKYRKARLSHQMWYGFQWLIHDFSFARLFATNVYLKKKEEEEKKKRNKGLSLQIFDNNNDNKLIVAATDEAKTNIKQVKQQAWKEVTNRCNAT